MVDRDEFQDADPQEEMTELISKELSANKRKLSEIKDQIDQMQMSVDREQQKYTSIATEIRTLKDTLDTVPREDIRDKYDEALDVRFRLATMRGTLEKFESHYEHLEKEQSLLSQLMSNVQGTTFIADEDLADNGNTRSGLDIVGIIKTQEEERKRLSRQMHDGPAQSLTNFILQAEICERLFNRNPDRAGEELNNLKVNASKTFQRIRDFIFDLRPMMLDDLGVAPTVRRYVDSFGEKNDINTELEILNEDRRLENYREVLIFRSIQDLMGMARDYAAPTELRVRLDMSSNPIKMLVEDDGRGFDAAAIFTQSEEGYADARVESMATLKSKFELVEGSISVESNENEGTTIRLELPSGD